MRIASIIGLVAGLASLIGLIAWQGVADIADVMMKSDWRMLLVPLVWLPTLFMNARCWQLLFHADRTPRFWPIFFAQWMGRAVNTLLPVASIGGEIVKARVAILWGADRDDASAATVVDKTVQVVTTILWGLIGVSLLAWITLDNTMVLSASVTLATLGAGVAGFLVVQKAGMFHLAVSSAHRVTKSDYFGDMIGAAGAIDARIHDTYRQHGRLAAAVTWRMAALVLQTGEVWLAAYLLGYPISVVEALFIKSLTSTLSDAAFIVPNSYGVQEGAFVILGGFVGWTPDVALAISLVVRIREIVIDIPGLILWQHAEGRAFFKRRHAAKGGERP